jgi:multidrug efflux pump subunit AcrA (membrane-fusion protein)
MRTSFHAAWLVLAAALAGCGDSQNHAAAPPPPAVTVANPAKQTIVDQDEYVGRFVAVDSVEVRARLSGYLSRIHFQDGQMVKQGDLLFTVDRRPFQIALDQARANLELAKANLAFAESDLARGQELLRNKTITEQTRQPRLRRRRPWSIRRSSISTSSPSCTPRWPGGSATGGYRSAIW